MSILWSPEEGFAANVEQILTLQLHRNWYIQTNALSATPRESLEYNFARKYREIP